MATDAGRVIPVAAGHQATAPAESSAHSLRRTLRMQPLAGIHVLLVDDDGDARDIMQTIMEYQGALAVVAPSAKTALVVMETMKPGVLVSDISMPEHDGFWLLGEARGRGWLGGVATLAVTALDLGLKQMTDAGFDSFLRKPVEPNVLCNSVQALARGRKGLAS